jgi:hypothetical protein
MHREGLLGDRKALKAYKKCVDLLGADLNAGQEPAAVEVVIEDLPEARVQELLQAFELFDKDSSGAIDQQELGCLLLHSACHCHIWRSSCSCILILRCHCWC